MEKRVFLAIFLSFVVLAVYQTYIVPPPPAVPERVPAATEAVAAAPTPPLPPPPAIEMPATVLGDALARDIVVETDTIRAVFSTEGATLKSWQLKGYGVELVPAQLPASFPRPYALATDDVKISAILAAARFRPTPEGPIALGANTGTLRFEYRDASGLNALKVFHFQPDGQPYVLAVRASIDVAGASKPVTLHWGPALGAGYSTGGSMSTASYPPAALFYRDGSVVRLDNGDITEQPRYDGVMRFAGVGDHYFLSAVLAGDKPVRVDYQPLALPIPNPEAGAPATRTYVAYSVTTPGPASVSYFLGPKDFDILKAVDSQLVRAIDFGIFAWLVVPLMQALKWINSYIGNFGWSIIILTFLLNVVMFPLRHRSMVSMRKMQELQPEVKAIQQRYEKYKVTDPERQKMNQEMMALYKQKGVNPASGCVPMLLTMPVLFAFYAMLAVAIELRGAPFFGWIKDLSVMDPLYITPVLMAGTMFWQQRLTPSTADPIQQKMFMLMPLIFGVMFLWAPAGLVIYWLTSNIMTIGQQYATNYLIGAPVRRPGGTTGSTANPRRVKSAGSGSTPKAQGQ